MSSFFILLKYFKIGVSLECDDYLLHEQMEARIDEIVELIDNV